MYIWLHIHKLRRLIVTRRALVSETTNIISCDAPTPQAVVFVTYFRYSLRSDGIWKWVRVTRQLQPDIQFLNWIMLQITNLNCTLCTIIKRSSKDTHYTHTHTLRQRLNTISSWWRRYLGVLSAKSIKHLSKVSSSVDKLSTTTYTANYTQYAVFTFCK